MAVGHSTNFIIGIMFGFFIRSSVPFKLSAKRIPTWGQSKKLCSRLLESKLFQPVIVATENVPIIIFSSQKVEDDCLEQLKGLASSVIPVGYVSAMPDVHLGKGSTIGTVFASESFVSPNAVGVDIGCGMTAIPLAKLFKNDLNESMKQKIHSAIKTVVPTGFNSFASIQPGVEEALEKICKEIKPTKWLTENILTLDKTKLQLGTLGGGNHFIEVVHDENEQVWVMLHSGSRYVGKTTAEHHNDIALKEMKANKIKNHPPGLAYLRIDSETGRNYLSDMRWCQLYAYYNREFMLNKVIEVVSSICGAVAEESRRINAHHNFCELTPCRYKDPKTQQVIEKKLWVTRKGATAAREGQYGIIPGSMGVGSYIVRGRGNTLSWESCSHGAGRLMSRTMAKKTISQEQFRESMRGIVYDSNSAELIDEAPMAYKNLDTVMRDQETLVEVVHRLLPLVNVKGF